MRQRLLRTNIPARAIRGGLAIDQHVAMLISKLAVFRCSEEGVGCPCAGVQNQDDRRLCLQFLRDVDEHLDAGRIGAEVLNLSERGALDELVVRVDGCTLNGADSHEAGDEVGEMHVSAIL